MNRKPIYVLDATPIIYFAKIGKLDLILDICDARITVEVYSETVEKGGEHADSVKIKDAIRRGKMKVYGVKRERIVKALLRHAEIHLGEAETIAASKELDGLAVIDEEEARTIARMYGVRTAPGTLFLLFRLLRLKKMDVSDAEVMLTDLVTSGLYLDSRTLQGKRKAAKISREQESTVNL